VTWLAAWFACGHEAHEPTACDAAHAAAPGPLAAKAAAAPDALALAEIRLREARLTADPGFYTLADLALQCHLTTHPGDPEARALRGHVLVQFHRFAEAEALLAPLAQETGAWRHWMFLGDARVDQGDLAGAEAAWNEALDRRPTLQVWDRLGDLAYQRGDLATAIAFGEQAFGAATPDDPEVMAWVATRLGWYRAMAGAQPNELGVALRVMPDHVPANLVYARFMLATGHPDLARAALDRAGRGVEALRLRRELDPTVDVSAARLQDRRGWALVLAETDPAAALLLLDQELAERRDAYTRIARGWVASRAGREASAEVREALAVGILDPEARLLAAEVLRDPTVVSDAAARLLLPSEQARLARLRAP
jgi:tetratricopeptide (TPR) repeat protein